MSVLLKKNEGISVVALLIAIALGGILAVILAGFLDSSLVSIRKQQDLNALEDLRRHVRIGLTCPLPPATWVVNQEIAVPSKSSASPLINIGTAGYTKIGSYCLRARVASITPGKELNIQYSKDCTSWTALFDLNIQCP